MSSVITISQPPVVPGGKPDLETHSEITFAPMDPDMDPDELDFDIDINGSDVSDAEASTADKVRAREDSLSKLEKSNPTTPTSPSEKTKAKAPDVDGKTPGPSTPTRARPPKRQPPEKEKRPDAIIVLKEEKVRCMLLTPCVDPFKGLLQASTFHDFLKYVYPQ